MFFGNSPGWWADMYCSYLLPKQAPQLAQKKHTKTWERVDEQRCSFVSIRGEDKIGLGHCSFCRPMRPSVRQINFTPTLVKRDRFPPPSDGESRLPGETTESIFCAQRQQTTIPQVMRCQGVELARWNGFRVERGERNRWKEDLSSLLFLLSPIL